MHCDLRAASLLAGAWLLLSIPCALAHRPNRNYGALPTVTLDSGVVVGTTTVVPSATARVNKFLGIPFAASPPERFSPPQDPQSWSGALDASAFRPACIQQFNYPEASRNSTITLFNNPAPPESEDCLYLNVFAPARPQAGGGRGRHWAGGRGGDGPGGREGGRAGGRGGGRAVMFWIYGGGLAFGSASNPAYDGSYFAANEDVVVVTTNYRTNVFGFPNSPQIPVGSQNLGFLDQRKALEWVQQNIAKFGGDPDKVTIFGESAGGYSVKQLWANPPSPLTFRAAIMQSQATYLGSGAPSWAALAAALGCAAGASQIDCVRAAPATTIKSIIEVNRLLFPPVDDDVTDSVSVADAITSGRAADIPILIGTNSEEGRLYSRAVTNVTTYLEATFPNQPALQAAIEAAYPASVYGSPFFIAAAIITDLSFQCPAAALANLAAANGYDVWRYYFNASFPNAQPFPNAGVYHASEIPIVFGTYRREGATAQQVALSNYIQNAWAMFAKNPSGGPGWPQLGTNGGLDLASLGGNGNFGEYEITEESVDFNCPLYEEIIAARGLGR